MQRHLLHKTWHAVLSGRGVLALEGRDTHKLLQGLATCDVTALEEGAQPQHTAFLAHNGRMLFDAFLIPGPADSVLIDAEAAAIPALAAHLRRYKLRSKVTFTDRTADFAVVAICGQDAAASAAAAMTPGSTPDSGAASNNGWRTGSAPRCVGNAGPSTTRHHCRSPRTEPPPVGSTTPRPDDLEGRGRTPSPCLDRRCGRMR